MQYLQCVSNGEIARLALSHQHSPVITYHDPVHINDGVDALCYDNKSAMVKLGPQDMTDVVGHSEKEEFGVRSLILFEKQFWKEL